MKAESITTSMFSVLREQMAMAVAAILLRQAAKQRKRGKTLLNRYSRMDISPLISMPRLYPLFSDMRILRRLHHLRFQHLRFIPPIIFLKTEFGIHPPQKRESE